MSLSSESRGKMHLSLAEEKEDLCIFTIVCLLAYNKNKTKKLFVLWISTRMLDYVPT